MPGINGDGLKMMWEAGAQQYGDTVEMIYILPHNQEYMVADGVLRQPNLMLNQKGERFMDEGMLGNTTFSGNAIFQQPGHYACVIMDRVQYPAAGFKMLEPVIKKAEENGCEAIRSSRLTAWTNWLTSELSYKSKSTITTNMDRTANSTRILTTSTS